MQPAISGTEIQSAEQDALIHRIRQLFLEKLAVRLDSADADLLESGVLDSALLVELILHLEHEFGVRLAMAELGVEGFRSLAAIAQTIRTRISMQKRSLNGGQNGAGTDLVGEVRKVLTQMLLLRVGSPDADLFKTGVLDSMSLVQLIVELERHFQLELPMEEIELDSFRSVNNIVAFIAHHKLAHLASHP